MKKSWEEFQAIYVHIPFCVQKCLYCDFASYANCSQQLKDEYVEALCQEIRKPLGLAVNERATVYFGGGTPSLLDLKQIARIVELLKEQGLWKTPAEATIEVNPGTVDLAKLKGLKALGFTRISMGVQSLRDEELKTIGRIHTAKQALEALEMATTAGFEHINADVIYGLPKQSLESLRATLEGLVATAIDHISVYGLILEEGTPLEALVEKNMVQLPEEELTADMYDFVQEFLKEQGFVRYEISNYARLPKDKPLRLEQTGYSRHNDVYWRYLPYGAFGASAVSFDGSKRYTRPAEVAEYVKWAREFRPASYEAIAENLTSEERFSEYIFMGLRRTRGLSLEQARERFGIDILEHYGKQLEPYFARQLLVYDKAQEQLYLTEKGMAIGNQIFELFV